MLFQLNSCSLHLSLDRHLVILNKDIPIQHSFKRTHLFSLFLKPLPSFKRYQPEEPATLTYCAKSVLERITRIARKIALGLMARGMKVEVKDNSLFWEKL